MMVTVIIIVPYLIMVSKFADKTTCNDKKAQERGLINAKSVMTLEKKTRIAQHIFLIIAYIVSIIILLSGVDGSILFSGSIKDGDAGNILGVFLSSISFLMCSIIEIVLLIVTITSKKYKSLQTKADK